MFLPFELLSNTQEGVSLLIYESNYCSCNHELLYATHTGPFDPEGKVSICAILQVRYTYKAVPSFEYFYILEAYRRTYPFRTSERLALHWLNVA